MPDESDEVVEVVVWRQYWVAAKRVHRRAWFWLAAAVVVLAVLLAFAWHHKDRCRAEYPVGGTGLIYVPEHPHHPVTPPPPVVVPPPPVAPPVHHVPVHRVVHHAKRHRCCCH
jgi:hypothetical protein